MDIPIDIPTIQLGISSMSIITLVGLTIKIVGNTRRELKRDMADKVKNVVYRDVCHTAQDGIKSKIEDLDKHIDTRFDDLKDFIIKNGFNNGKE